MPDMPWRMRRTWRADAKAWAQHEQAAQTRWQDIGGPVLERVDADIAALEQRLEGLRGDVARYDDWVAQHPEAARRLARIDRDLEVLRTVERLDRYATRAMGLDRGVEPPGVDRGIEPPGRGIELGW